MVLPSRLMTTLLDETVALQVTGRAAPYVEPPSDALGELLGASSCWEIYSTS
jgi:hypothetical protein